jgi:predicted aconitase with swiveling domain
MQTGMPRESMPLAGRVALMPEARGEPTTDHYILVKHRGGRAMAQLLGRYNSATRRRE